MSDTDHTSERTSAMPTPIAIGIDPSLTRTAVAIVDETSITVRSLPTKGSKGASLRERWERLYDIAEFTVSHLRQDEFGRPVGHVYIESPAHSQVTGHHHDRSGLYWLILDRLMACGFPVTEVSPQQLKMYATGKGNAGKDEILIAMTRRHDWLGVDNNDEMDAAVLALIGARLAGHPIDGDLPQTHLRALTKLEGSL